MVATKRESLRIQLVNDNKLRDEIFRLRYRAYLSEGEIPESRSGIFSDEYDERPNQVTWALFDGDRLVGTMRSMFYQPSGQLMLPEHKVFGDFLVKSVPNDVRVVSGNRFAVDPDTDRNDKRYSFALLKHHMMVALVKADWAVAAVRTNHLAFYRRVLQMQVSSEPRYYDEMNSGFTLLSANVLDNYSAICSRHPSLRASTSDLALLKSIPESFDAPGVPAPESAPAAQPATSTASQAATA